MNEKLLANIRFSFAQSVFTSKCHFKAHDRLTKRKERLSCLVKCLSGATLAVLVLQIIGLQGKYQNLLNISAYLGLLLTAASLAFEIFNKDDITQNIAQHKKYAEGYNRLRDKYMDLIEETMSGAISDDQIRIKKEVLQKSYFELGEGSPHTTGKDYMQSQCALGLSEKSNEEFTWNDKEIDRFLPEYLRLNK